MSNAGDLWGKPEVRQTIAIAALPQARNIRGKFFEKKREGYQTAEGAPKGIQGV